MKKFLIATLILFSILPTCESVWGFSNEHDFIWDTHFELRNDKESKKDNIKEASNIVYYSCSNQHSSSHSPCKDCCSWKDDNPEISLPSWRESMRLDLKLDSVNETITFNEEIRSTKDIPCDKFPSTIKFDKTSYFNLIGIIKNLN